MPWNQRRTQSESERHTDEGQQGHMQFPKEGGTAYWSRVKAAVTRERDVDTELGSGA
jgi:hypothetical protein